MLEAMISAESRTPGKQRHPLTGRRRLQGRRRRCFPQEAKPSHHAISDGGSGYSRERDGGKVQQDTFLGAGRIGLENLGGDIGRSLPAG